MRQSDVAATIMLVVMSFITLVLAITFNMVRDILWEQMIIGANLINKTTNSSIVPNISQSMLPTLTNYTTVFWLLFIFFLIGTIVMYIVGSHREEHETYRPPEHYPPNNY